MTALRRLYPILRRRRFLTGEMNEEIDVKDVTWIDARGVGDDAGDWDNEITRCFGMLLDGRAQATGIKRRGDDVTLLFVFNAHHDAVKFALPRCYDASGWNRLIDTNDPALPARRFRIGVSYLVTGRSLLLFERAPLVERKPRARPPRRAAAQAAASPPPGPAQEPP